MDCEAGKGRPCDRSSSPGNIQATYHFQILAMDHIPSLPRSFRGNTELLIWVDRSLDMWLRRRVRLKLCKRRGDLRRICIEKVWRE